MAINTTGKIIELLEGDICMCYSNEHSKSTLGNILYCFPYLFRWTLCTSGNIQMYCKFPLHFIIHSIIHS